jgi:hypothetical protein
MPVSTIEPRRSFFQLFLVPSGVHRTVTEPLLPSLQHISPHHQSVTRETNMFRDFDGVFLAKAVPFRWSSVAGACSWLAQSVAAANGCEVIR